MIYTINNCIRAFGYTNFDKLIADMGSVDNLKEYVRANGYADIAVAEDTELLLVDVNGKTWHTGCYGAQLGPEPDYLCFTSTGDSTVAMQQNGAPNKSANKVIRYKLNNGQWQNWNLSAVSLADGDKMYIKSDDTIPISETGYIYKYFIISGSIAASGNIMSLINFSDTLTDYAFNDLFKDCTSLTTAPALPATTLSMYCYASMFKGCTSLTTAPELPATTLAQGCYHSMFEACTSLAQATELPAISLGEGCYANMFKGCTSLVQAPELPATMLNRECYTHMFGGCTSLVNVPTILPATTLQYRCYKHMFYNCTSLTQTPALPATTLADECYNEMFNRCTSLTQAPELPATTLAQYCYTYMFNECTSLTQAPSLPATTLAQGCYTEMFMNCTSLVQAPELPATTLTPYCYVEMFSGCTNLNYVKAMFTDISAQGCLNSWLNNVSSTGTFIKSKDATWTNEQAGIPTGWTVQVEGGVTPEPGQDYLCFTSTGDSTVAMMQNGTPSTSANKVIQYKLNDGQWQNWDLSAVTLHDGDKMYLKSVNEIPMSEADSICKQFVMTGSIAASGNIMSLLNFSDALTDYAFCNLFKECTSLTQAPTLPATTLAGNCYEAMFSGCTSLTTTPELPATTLANYCYSQMFYSCTSLTTTPELPATTLTQYCYSQMFNGCTALTTAPALPATTLVWYCYFDMFNGCSSLTTAPELHATSLGNSCYKSMFSGCSSLTQAPALPATELVEECYYSMFANCTSLTTAPELPATTLTEGCYSFMFLWCPNLNYVKAMFTTDPTTTNYLTDWLEGVSPTGTFIKNKDATWTNEQAKIPTGWTVQVEGGVTPEPEKDYLCFTSTGDSTVAMTQNGTPNTSANKVIQYRLNDGQWQTWDLSAITLADGDKMYLKSDDEIPISESYNICKNFVMTGSIAASGNIMSLLNFSDTLTNNAFIRLFSNCTSLTQAPALPATTLVDYCYSNMFYGCTSLTQAPFLPATTLAKSCYFNMFNGCISLTQAPELPATTLATFCYEQMFISCSKLNYVKAMFTNAIMNALGNWLSDVSETGTFVKNSAATWTNADAGIPSGWTVQTASPDK